MKVYCSECKYSAIDSFTLTMENTDYLCKSKNNISYRDKSNWYAKDEDVSVYKDKPEDINKHNRCLWYERKE